MYKVVSKKIAENMLNGSVRIGSSNYYRSIEDEDRADDAEGARSIEITNSEDDMTLSVEQVNNLFKQAGEPFRSNKIGLTIKGSKGKKISMVSDVNMLMFCVTHKKDLIKFGGTVLKIVDPDRFGLAVSKSLISKIANGEVKLNGLPSRIEFKFSPVYYSNKQSVPFVNNPESPPVKLQDFFTKPEKYKNEQEIRFVWYFLAKDGTMHPLPSGFKYIDLQLEEKNLFELVA